MNLFLSSSQKVGAGIFGVTAAFFIAANNNVTDPPSELKIKQEASSQRKDYDTSSWYVLNGPKTPEEIEKQLAWEKENVHKSDPSFGYVDDP